MLMMMMVVMMMVMMMDDYDFVFFAHTAHIHVRNLYDEITTASFRSLA